MNNLFKGTYIKLDRVIMQWEWYKCSDVKSVFIHCLLKANHESKMWQGININRGQFVTSYSKLASETGLTVRKIRTSLKRLKMTHELTCETTNQYTMITINKYNDYQKNDTMIDNQMTRKRQTNDKQMTTTNNNKNNKNNKNDKKYTTQCVNVELSAEDKNILLTYARKSNARNIDAYIHTLIQNGGYKQIIEEEKKKNEYKQSENYGGF